MYEFVIKSYIKELLTFVEMKGRRSVIKEL